MSSCFQKIFLFRIELTDISRSQTITQTCFDSCLGTVWKDDNETVMVCLTMIYDSTLINSAGWAIHSDRILWPRRLCLSSFERRVISVRFQKLQNQIGLQSFRGPAALKIETPRTRLRARKRTHQGHPVEG